MVTLFLSFLSLTQKMAPDSRLFIYSFPFDSRSGWLDILHNDQKSITINLSKKPSMKYGSDSSDGGLASNKLMIIQPDGSMTSYFKTHMVPVTEAPNYVKGNSEIPSIRTKYGVISAIICFDDSYISFMHGFGAKVNKEFPNTDILFAPSWDWEDIAEVHSTLTEFRAMENGYALVKPTYDGISVVVDRYGRRLLEKDIAQIGYDSVCCVDVPVTGQQTFYGRWGNVIDPALAGVGIILLITAVIRMKVVKPESP